MSRRNRNRKTATSTPEADAVVATQDEYERETGERPDAVTAEIINEREADAAVHREEATGSPELFGGGEPEAEPEAEVETVEVPPDAEVVAEALEQAPEPLEACNRCGEPMDAADARPSRQHMAEIIVDDETLVIHAACLQGSDKIA